MRKWSELKTRRQKARRVKDVVFRFFKGIWGDYRRGGVCGAYHWVRCHTWNRYHIVDVRNEADYDWGWIERDHLMLLSCFKILRMFVEEEYPDVGQEKLEDYMYEDCPPDHIELVNAKFERGKEIRELYAWWTEVRPKEHEKCYDLLRDVNIKFHENGINVSDRKKAKTWHERRQELDAKDDEMLGRLMKIRGRLWT